MGDVLLGTARTPRKPAATCKIGVVFYSYHKEWCLATTTNTTLKHSFHGPKESNLQSINENDLDTCDISMVRLMNEVGIAKLTIVEIMTKVCNQKGKAGSFFYEHHGKHISKTIKSHGWIKRRLWRLDRCKENVSTTIWVSVSLSFVSCFWCCALMRWDTCFHCLFTGQMLAMMC